MFAPRTRPSASARALAGHALLTAALVLLLVHACPSAVAADGPYAGKRIFWVESYNPGNPWTDGIARGVEQTLDGTGATLKVVHMDTRRNPSPEFAREAGRRTIEALRAFAPDVVMASDDNAQQYLVLPYLRGGRIPVVFSGVNWDATVYGYPASNVTGMVEVNLLDAALTMLRRHANGKRVAYVAADSASERKNLVIYNRRGATTPWQAYFISRFSDLAETYNRAQDNADMIILGGTTGIEGWDDDEAARIIAENIRIPSASFDTYTAPLSALTFAKKPEEQGQWMAATALRILDGAAPTDIPLTENHQANLIVNIRLARAAGMVLPVSVLKTATVIGKD